MPASAWLANGVLDYIFNGSALTQPSVYYVQLHTADPGDDGAGFEQTVYGGTRIQCTDWTAASGKTLSNNAAVLFDNASSSQSFTHISIWDASTSGNCIATAPITGAPKSVVATDDLNFAVGEIDVTIT